MKNLSLILLALLASLTRAWAQVTVEILPGQDQFLPDESMTIGVRIVNRSGQVLQLGKDADWLKFSVEAKDGFLVFKEGEVPVAGEFSLESAQAAIKRVDIAPHYKLSKTGRYSVIATVKIKQWDMQVSSAPHMIDVARGVKLWDQEFGVPSTRTAGGPPETRKYTLLKAMYRDSSRLYLRVTDTADSQVFRVFPLGPAISFSRLDPQIDSKSNLHLVYQAGSHSFLYNMVSPDGELLERRTYDYTAIRPRLKVDNSGKIVVYGGVRHYLDTDIPAPPEVPLADVKTPQP